MAFSYNRLTKIAAVGGICAVALGIHQIYRVAMVHNNSSYFQEALAAVQSHAGVKKFIGSPLSVGYVQIVPHDEPTSIAQFTVKIKGPIASGAMYFWAERKINDDKLVIEVNRIEVEIGDDKTKRLVVKGQ